MLDSLQGLNESTQKQKDRLTRLEAFYGDMDTKLLLETMLHQEFKNQIALFSSFGADSALLISLVAEVDPATPILFSRHRKTFQGNAGICRNFAPAIRLERYPHFKTGSKHRQKHRPQRHIVEHHTQPLLLDAQG